MNNEEFGNAIRHSQWCVDVTKAVLAVVESMAHHKKYTQKITDAVKKALGDGHQVWHSDGYSSYDLVIRRQGGQQITFYIKQEDDWAVQFIGELKSRIEINTKYTSRLKAELAVHSELQKLSDELLREHAGLQVLARRLLPPSSENDDEAMHFTYATQEMFPYLLKNKQ